MSVKAGDRLASIDSAWGEMAIRGYGTVERITPTGIVVLEDGTRLKASRFDPGSYEVRGSTGWHRSAYYPLDHEAVEWARKNTWRRKAASAVQSAFDDWKSRRDAQSALALAKAAREYAEQESLP